MCSLQFRVGFVLLAFALLAIGADTAADHYNQALAFKYKRDSISAIREFSEALKLKPDWSLAHYGLGAAYCDHGDLEQCRSELRKAIELDPNNAAARSYLASVLLRANELPAAIEQLEAVCRLRPDDPHARAELGLAISTQATPRKPWKSFAVISLPTRTMWRHGITSV